MIAGKRIGFMPGGSYNDMSTEQVCESLAKIGYDAVEWTPHFISPRSKSKSEIENLVKITKTAGLTVSAVVMQRDVVIVDEALRKDEIALLCECIDVYSDVGIDTINLFTGPVPWGTNPLVIGEGISQGAAWDLLFAAFDKLVPLAEKKNMKLAVENVFGMLCCDFFSLKHLIDHYNSPALGVNYDPSHDILFGHTDIGWIIRQWGKDKIHHVHLKDAVGIQKLGKFLFPLPGEGNVDWTAFDKALSDIGYDGIMSVEFESFEYAKKIFGGDWEKAAKLSYENFKILFEG